MNQQQPTNPIREKLSDAEWALPQAAWANISALIPPPRKPTPWKLWLLAVGLVIIWQPAQQPKPLPDHAQQHPSHAAMDMAALPIANSAGQPQMPPIAPVSPPTAELTHVRPSASPQDAPSAAQLAASPAPARQPATAQFAKPFAPSSPQSSLGVAPQWEREPTTAERQEADQPGNSSAMPSKTLPSPRENELEPRPAAKALPGKSSAKPAQANLLPLAKRERQARGLPLSPAALPFGRDSLPHPLRQQAQAWQPSRWSLYLHGSATLLGKTLRPNHQDEVEITQLSSTNTAQNLGNYGLGLSLERRLMPNLWLRGGLSYRYIRDDVRYRYTEGAPDRFEMHQTAQANRMLFTPKPTQQEQHIVAQHHLAVFHLGMRYTCLRRNNLTAHLGFGTELYRNLHADIRHVHPMRANLATQIGGELLGGVTFRTNRFGMLRLESFVQWMPGSLYAQPSIYQVQPYLVGLRLGKVFTW